MMAWTLHVMTHPLRPLTPRSRDFADPHSGPC
jgi:hypothetical protein